MSFGLGHGRDLDPGDWGMDQKDLPPFDQGKWDPRRWFAHPERRFELEIGSGKGTFLLQQSPLEPMTNFLGMEWTNEFYRYAADRLRRHETANVRLMRANAYVSTRMRNDIETLQTVKDIKFLGSQNAKSM